MSHIQFGQAVKYVLGEQEFDALVLGTREDLASHLGKDGEPLVTLVYADLDASFSSRSGEVSLAYRYDVPHESHDAANKVAVTPVAVAPGGRWRAAISPAGIEEVKQAAGRPEPPTATLPEYAEKVAQEADQQPPKETIN